jgi:hypothetical protein
MNVAEYECNTHRDDQSSSSGILDGGADENRELEYPSLARIRITVGEGKKLPDFGHEEIDAGFGGSPSGSCTK